MQIITPLKTTGLHIYMHVPKSSDFLSLCIKFILALHNSCLCLRYTNISTNDPKDSQNNSSHQTQSRDIRDYRTGVRSLPYNNRTRRVVFSTETFIVRYNTIYSN